MRCWCGYLSGARCRLFAYGSAYGSADATAIPLYDPIISCLIEIQAGFTFLVPAYPSCPWEETVNGCSSSYIYLVCLSTPCVVCQVHKLTHTGVKRFACPVCGRLHITSSRLSAHLRTHSDEKRYGWDHTHHSIADQTIAVLPGTKAHRSNWCSASSLGWPFPAVKY